MAWASTFRKTPTSTKPCWCYAAVRPRTGRRQRWWRYTVSPNPAMKCWNCLKPSAPAMMSANSGAWAHGPPNALQLGTGSFTNWYDETLAEDAIKVSESAELQSLNRHATLIAPNPNFAKVYKDVDEDAEQHIFASVSADLQRTMRSTPKHGIRVARNAAKEFRRGIDRPTRFFLAFRACPSTTRTLAMRSTRPCLSTAYHGLQFRSTGNEYPNAVIAFLNSTLGWLQVLNQRAF